MGRGQPHLPEQALEERAGQHVPGNGVGDGGEDPVQLAQRRLAVSLLAGDAVDQLLGQALVPQQAARAEPAQRHLHTPQGAARAGTGQRQASRDPSDSAHSPNPQAQPCTGQQRSLLANWPQPRRFALFDLKRRTRAAYQILSREASVILHLPQPLPHAAGKPHMHMQIHISPRLPPLSAQGPA